MEQAFLSAEKVDSIDSLRSMNLPRGANVILESLKITEVKEGLEIIALKDHTSDNSKQIPLTGFVDPKEFERISIGDVVDISAGYYYEKTLGSYTGKHPEIHADLNEYAFIYKIQSSY